MVSTGTEKRPAGEEGRTVRSVSTCETKRSMPDSFYARINEIKAALKKS